MKNNIAIALSPEAGTSLPRKLQSFMDRTIIGHRHTLPVMQSTHLVIFFSVICNQESDHNILLTVCYPIRLLKLF